LDAVALAAYFAFHESLPAIPTWWDVVVLGLLVMPAVFLTVALVLPLWNDRARPWLALAFVLLAIGFSLLGWEGPASFAKLGAATFVAWWFLELFEDLSWVVLVSLIIPWVDAYSVWRGPTKTIVEHHESVFARLSFAFPVVGESGTANLGVPDLLFFALFLAAAMRWRLRVEATWLLAVLSFGATIALAVWRDLGGLPALPGLSLAFLLANGDIVVRRFRERRARA
jgi:hypothetical protein